MSYTEQAQKINQQLQLLKNIFINCNIADQEKEHIINAVLWFGQVAKFRCRSNTAYDGFCKEVFKDIVEIERKNNGNLDFDVLQVIKCN